MTRFQYVAGLFVVSTMAMAGGALATFLMQKAQPVHAQEEAGVITGKEIRLVDAKGNPRALLDTGEDGSVRFTMFDKDQKPRLQLGADAEQASISFLDGAGTPRYLVAQRNKGNDVLVTFLDAKGRTRYIQSLTSEGASLLAFQGPKEEQIMTLMGGGDAPATLILGDPASKAQAVLLASKDQTSLSLDAKDSSVLNAALGSGQAVLGLSHDGKLRVRAMAGADGTPEIITLNEKKEATWRAGTK